MELRLKKGISQKDMADKIGMEQSGYSKLEHKGDDIGFSTVKKICSVLEIDPVSLSWYEQTHWDDYIVVPVWFQNTRKNRLK
mgnify:CR=1 FL=1